MKHIISHVLCVCSLVLGVSGAWAAPHSPDTSSAALSRVVKQGHYDLLVGDFSAMAEEMIHHALAKGYYIPIDQRRRLLVTIRNQLGPEILTNRLLSRMEKFSDNNSVVRVVEWYQSPEGKQVLAAIDQAHQPGAERRQKAIAKALRADAGLMSWWQNLDSRFPYTQYWLAQRQSIIYQGVTHLAAVMEPHTPFNQNQFREALELATFDLRADVDSQWQLRFLDSVRNLAVTERVRYQKFSLSSAHLAFLKLIAEQTEVVVDNATAELKLLLSDLVLPKQPENPEPSEPTL